MRRCFFCKFFRVRSTRPARKRQARRPGLMGRRKIDIVRIENERHRQVTFTKRRSGLIKKATELAVLCDANVTVMITVANQKMILYSSGPVDEMINRYQEQRDTAEVPHPRPTPPPPPLLCPPSEHPPPSSGLLSLAPARTPCLIRARASWLDAGAHERRLLPREGAEDERRGQV